MSKATSAEAAIVGGHDHVRDVVSVILEDFSPSNPRRHLAKLQLWTTRLALVRDRANFFASPLGFCLQQLATIRRLRPEYPTQPICSPPKGRRKVIADADSVMG